MRYFLPRGAAFALLCSSCIFIFGGCSQDLSGRMGLQSIGDTLGIGTSDSDPSVRKISTDASVPVLLSSNKPETTFTVNGTALSPAKSLKVLVPRTRLIITAQAPCYHTLTQTAEANGFERASLFQFDFGNWDRVQGAQGSNCV
jgi:hypothetical protein